MSTLKLLLLAILLTGLSACGRREVHVPVIPSDNPGPPDYADLRAGDMLRIVLPVLKPGNKSPVLKSEPEDGTTISLSASNLIGYKTVIYSINGKRSGRVQLKFASAELTQNGIRHALPEPPRLPFSLPQKSEYIRLLYLQRLSASDHNMAIIASKRMNDLVRLTMQILKNSEACAIAKQASCSWVPVGVAVRPEEPFRR